MDPEAAYIAIVEQESDQRSSAYRAARVQVGFSERSIGVTLPYFGEHAVAMMKCVKCCMETLWESGGYVTYDPQLGRIVTPKVVESMAGMYRSMDAHLPDIAARAQFTPPDKKPWWKFW